MKKLKIKRLINKFICLAAAGIMLFGPQFAFADDSLSPSPVEIPEEDSYSSEELDFLSEASDDNDLIIRQAVVQAVRATSSSITLDNLYDLLFACITNTHGRYEWCVTDQALYNLLNNNFSHYDSNSGNTYDTGAMLWLVLTHLGNISNEIVPALSSSPTLYSIQSQILSALNNLNAELIPASSSADTLYEITSDLDDTLNAFFTAFQSFASSQINYTSALYYNNIGVAQYAYQTNQTTANVFTMLNNILKPLISNIDTNISYLKSNSDILVSNTNNINNTLQSESDDLQNKIDLLKFELSNITWSTSNNFLGLKTTLNGSYITGNNNISNITDLFVDYNSINENNLYSYVFKFCIPVQYGLPYKISSIKDVEIYSGSTKISSSYNFSYTWDNPANVLNIYISSLDLPSSGRTITLKISFNSSVTLRNMQGLGYGESIQYIDSSNIDFYTVSDWIIQDNNIRIMQLWKDLYASDDLIAAKQAQQSVENQAIADFTGSGSASSGVSDVVGVKQISSTLKSGLPTQGSISNALSIFNSSNDIWGWFSQSNYDDINNPSLQTRDSIIVDFISQNENSYYNYLSEGSER